MTRHRGRARPSRPHIGDDAVPLYARTAPHESQFFSTAQRVWHATPVEPSAEHLGLSLIFRDFVLDWDTLKLAVQAVLRQAAESGRVARVLLLKTERHGWRTLVLCDVTIALGCGTRQAEPLDLRASMEAVLQRLVPASRVEGVCGSLLDRLLLGAKAHVSLVFPAALAAYGSGRLLSRASTPAAHERILGVSVHSCPAIPSPTARALTGFRHGGLPSAIAGGLKEDLARLVRSPHSERERWRAACKLAQDAQRIGRERNDPIGVLVADYVLHLFHADGRTRRIRTVSSYVDSLTAVLGDEVPEVSFSDQGDVIVDTSTLHALRAAFHKRFARTSSRDMAALEWLERLVGSRRSGPQAVGDVAPCELVAAKDVARAQARIRAEERLPVWQMEAAQALLAATAVTGLRVSETVELMTSDVCLFDGMVHTTVSERSSRMLKTRSADRIVLASCTGLLANYFLQYVKGQADRAQHLPAYVFTAPGESEPHRELTAIVYTAMAGVQGVGSSLHGIRHGLATSRVLHAVQQAIDGGYAGSQLQALLSVASQVGHARVETTFQHYVHFLEYAYAEAAAKDLDAAKLSPVLEASVLGVRRETVWRRRQGGDSTPRHSLTGVLRALGDISGEPDRFESPRSCDSRVALTSGVAGSEARARSKPSIESAVAFVHWWCQGLASAEIDLRSGVNAVQAAALRQRLLLVAGDEYAVQLKPDAMAVNAKPVVRFTTDLAGCFAASPRLGEIQAVFRRWSSRPDNLLQVAWPGDEDLVASIFTARLLESFVVTAFVTSSLMTTLPFAGGSAPESSTAQAAHGNSGVQLPPKDLLPGVRARLGGRKIVGIRPVALGVRRKTDTDATELRLRRRLAFRTTTALLAALALFDPRA